MASAILPPLSTTMDVEKVIPEHMEEAQSGVFLDDREEYDFLLSK